MSRRALAVVVLGASSCSRIAPQDELNATPDAAPCINADAASPYFEIVDPSVCIVAQYEVTTPPSSIGLAGFTWGRHGGPLRGPAEAAGARPSTIRYDAPDGATGVLTARETIFTMDSAPDAARWFPAAVDLPANDWTALSYTTGPFDGRDPGAIVTVNRERVQRVHPVLGGAYVAPYASAIVHASFAALGVDSFAADELPRPGVYLAEACGASGYLPTAPSCVAPRVLFEWDYDGGCCNARSSVVGPVATDPNGNVFGAEVGRSTIGGSQAIVFGLSAKQLRDGADKPTIIVMQLPVIERALQLAVDGERLYVDALTSYIDVRGGSYVDAYHYRLDSGGSRVEVTAARHVLRKATTSFRFVALFTDDRHRLWVGVSDAPRDGSAPASVNRFFVIARQ